MYFIGGGRYRARMADSRDDVSAALALRARAFRNGASDRDAFDDIFHHVLVHDTRTEKDVCCFRFARLEDGNGIGRSYSALYYDLSGLQEFPMPMVELGRFAVDSEFRDPDILRVAWNALAQVVDDAGAELLFGCSSFKGTQAEPYREPFALLGERHIAPARWLPKVKAPAVFRFAQMLRKRRPDMRAAMRSMPPLLRSYLSMGGWVSDHAVIDRDLGTLHVFTGLEIKAIPPGRARLMRTPVAAVPGT